MKKILIITYIFVFFVLTKTYADTLPVLVYHHIQKKVTSDVSCTPENFNNQIKGILDAGFTPLTIEETIKFLSGTLTNIKKPVLITFDDGYESLYHFALPVAKKHNVNMTVFIITSRIGKKPQFSRYLNKDQMREMYDSGVMEFGSHSHDLHTDTIRIFEAFNISNQNNPVTKLINDDLKKSSEILKEILDSTPISLAWPYGKFNSYFTTAAKENGFKIHFTSISGYNKLGSNLFSVKRIPVTSRDTVKSVLRKVGN